MENPARSVVLARLDGLIRTGRELHDELSADRFSQSAMALVRPWQQDCAVAINELSGGSKAHWLARAFSEAFLVRSVAHEAVQEAPLAEIVQRIVSALEQARESIATLADDPAASPTAAPRPHRFDFVHNRQLRPFLEHALVEAQDALEQGRFTESLMTTCGVIEAIITDALEHGGQNVHERSFEQRIATAELAGLIRSGCARLTPTARNYRDLLDAEGKPTSDVAVPPRDARVAIQVLQVVMRDLDPGR